MRNNIPLVTVEGLDFWDLCDLEFHLQILTSCENYEEGSTVWWALRIALKCVSDEIDRRQT